jgi:hypothetical protein
LNRYDREYSLYQISPRSLEACRRQGIDPEELLVRTAEDIKQQNKGKALDQENLELMARHYEERRREKVRVLLEVESSLHELAYRKEPKSSKMRIMAFTQSHLPK